MSRRLRGTNTAKELSPSLRLLNGTPGWHVLDQDEQEWLDQGDEEPMGNDLMRMSVVMGERIIKPLYILVERWEHKRYGTGKRRWQTDFTEAERKHISIWHIRLRAYYLITGCPIRGVRMKTSTLQLLRRAAFFISEV